MKKGIFEGMLVLALGLGIAIFLGSFAVAEETAQQPSQQQGGALGKQGMMGKMGMMGMMHKDSVVATSDGGVVILSGPRLLKYDASLTLVSEVELPRGKGKGPDQAPAAHEENAPMLEDLP